MNLLFVQEQPCIRALKYAEGLCEICPGIRIFFAYRGKTLTELYGHGDECFASWFPLGEDPAAVLRSIISQHGIKLIHCHNAPDTLTNLCIKLFRGVIPVVHDIHDLMSVRQTVYEDGLERMEDSSIWQQWERQAIENSDAVIAVSDEILDITCRKGYRLPPITCVYPNYIPKRFIPKMVLEAHRNTSVRPIRIVYEGFVSSNGSHYDLRQIFQSLAKEGIEVHIYPSRDNLDYESLAVSSPNIVYHPSLPPERLFKEIRKYDFGWAGFNSTFNTAHLDTVLPNKAFEYIACGLPVISFPHAALKRFLDTQRLGLVIEKISGLTDRLRSPNMAAIRKNVIRRRWDFTVEENIKAIVDIYMKLCQKDYPSDRNDRSREPEDTTGQDDFKHPFIRICLNQRN
jgi:glycosyltransferase involved in cell wall biosynthesis